MNNGNNNNNGFESHNTHDDHSQYGGIGRSLYDYLQPDQITQHSCIIFLLNIEYFEITYEAVQILP